jgi:mono/diheme cytochrome c family protein
MRLLIASAAAAAVIAVAGTAARTASQTPTPAQKIEAGKAVYATQKCSTCHMIAGVGGKSSTVLDDVGTKLKPEEIKAWITDPAPLTAKLKTKPKVPMKKYTLPEADLDNLVAYLSSLKKK